MANLKDCPHFSNHDDYYTPKSAWEKIKPFIDSKFGENATIFESFLLNSNEQSKKYLQELGYNVLGDKTTDFLSNDIPNSNDYDLIVSNPPFQRVKSFAERKSNLKYRCIEKLLELDKPFIIIMNSTNIHSRWYGELVRDKDIRFIYPTGKINYDKYKKGGVEKVKGKKSAAAFNSIFMTYKILDKNEWL